MPRTLNNWEPETHALLDALVAAGFTLSNGYNGEDVFNFDGDMPKFIGNLIACDEAHLFVVDPAGKRRWIYLVLGNNPGEIVSDYSCPVKGIDYLDAVTTAHYDRWIKIPQPTMEVA